jgi:hypothetical protein
MNFLYVTLQKNLIMYPPQKNLSKPHSQISTKYSEL